MKHLTLFSLILSFSSPFFVFGQGDKSMQSEVVISGEQLLFFQTALKEFEQQGLKIGEYKVSLYRVEDSYVVVFEDPLISPSQRGSSPNVRSFEVQMSLNGNV